MSRVVSVATTTNVGLPAAPQMSPGPQGLKSGEGAEPLWRKVERSPSAVPEEFMEELEAEEEEDVISAINKVLRFVEAWHMKETDPHRCIELERWINDLYNLKWEVEGVRAKPCPAST